MNLFMMFLIGGLIYVGIEVMYDNTSHRSMALVGSISFVIGGLISDIGLNIFLTCFLIGLEITIFEYVGGRIFNSDYKIWDYRKMFGNVHGQICIPFMLIWMLVISPMIIILYNGLKDIDWMNALISLIR